MLQKDFPLSILYLTFQNIKYIKKISPENLFLYVSQPRKKKTERKKKPVNVTLSQVLNEFSFYFLRYPILKANVNVEKKKGAEEM